MLAEHIPSTAYSIVSNYHRSAALGADRLKLPSGFHPPEILVTQCCSKAAPDPTDAREELKGTMDRQSSDLSLPFHRVFGPHRTEAFVLIPTYPYTKSVWHTLLSLCSKESMKTCEKWFRSSCLAVPQEGA